MKSRQVLVTVVLSALLVWPLLPGVPYDLVNTAILTCYNLVAALSLVLLIGMVGQISLGQAAFVGVGAFVSALATRKLGIHFPFVLFVGAAVGAVMASLIGVVALRVRGLYLAVATLIFAFVCDKYLFVQPWLVESQSGTSIAPEQVGHPGTIPFFDLGDGHVFYYVALAVAALAVYSLANVRESRVGRAWAAIRGSEVAAASLGIAVTRYKLLAFACAGALAGLGGSLTLVGQRTIAPEQFNFVGSLYFLAIAVVAGLRSIGGAIASALLFAVLVGEVFFRYPRLADYLDLISAGVLIVVLLFFRGGLGALPERARDLWMRSGLDDRLWLPLLAAIARLRAARPRRNPAVGESGERTAVDLIADVEEEQDHERVKMIRLPAERLAARVHRPATSDIVEAAEHRGKQAGEPAPEGRRLPWLLQADNITVKFGGLTAVNDVSLKVAAGEIVGLIGPNGAGKTTMFNSLLGLNHPTNGTVELFGQDVTQVDVHHRAALGVARTFQVIQLFSDLSVYDNLMVATHLQNKTGIAGSILASPSARRREREARRRVDAVLRLMELEDVADRPVAGLPFGVLRLIEVARTLVTGAPLVCFDEPASGLDSAETEKLIEWFRFLQGLGVTLLVIEHDVSMVVRLCDYIYVLDQGELISEGPPEKVQRDPRVISSYLGTTMEEAS